MSEGAAWGVFWTVMLSLFVLYSCTPDKGSVMDRWLNGCPAAEAPK